MRNETHTHGLYDYHDRELKENNKTGRVRFASSHNFNNSRRIIGAGIVCLGIALSTFGAHALQNIISPVAGIENLERYPITQNFDEAISRTTPRLVHNNNGQYAVVARPTERLSAVTSRLQPMQELLENAERQENVAQTAKVGTLVLGSALSLGAGAYAGTHLKNKSLYKTYKGFKIMPTSRPKEPFYKETSPAV